jgi:hypothetical protein
MKTFLVPHDRGADSHLFRVRIKLLTVKYEEKIRNAINLRLKQQTNVNLSVDSEIKE